MYERILLQVFIGGSVYTLCGFAISLSVQHVIAYFSVYTWENEINPLKRKVIHLLYAVLECDFSWTSLNESNVYGGIRSSSSNTVLDCQETCTRDADCTGVDFNAYNPPGSRCFLILTDGVSINVGQTPGVTHYSLAKNCEPFSRLSLIYLILQSTLFVSKQVSKFIERAMSEENHRIWGAVGRQKC